MQLKKALLMAGALALLAGAVDASGWGPGNMPWSGKGDAPWSRNNTPWSGRRHNMPWQGRRGGWGGNKGWEDWTPWGKGRKAPWNSNRWGDMPWSDNHKRWRGRAPYGYGQPGAYRGPYGQMMPRRGAPPTGMMPRAPRGGMGPLGPGRAPQARPPRPRPPMVRPPAPPSAR